LVPAGIADLQQAADVIQAELSAVGIEVVLQGTSLPSMLRTTLPSGAYQMALAPFLLTTFPAAQVPVYSGSVLPSGSPPPLSRGALTPLGTGPSSGDATVGVEPGASAAGVVTRDVFGLDDPTVTTDVQQALTNLNPTDDQKLILAAEARLWLDLPTIPLFQQPAAVVYASDIGSVSESPTWAGVFWDAQDWVIQKSSAVVPTSSVPSS
jgi:ABC-type transport system substrate-binding protein